MGKERKYGFGSSQGPALEKTWQRKKIVEESLSTVIVKWRNNKDMKTETRIFFVFVRVLSCGTVLQVDLYFRGPPAHILFSST